MPNLAKLQTLSGTLHQESECSGIMSLSAFAGTIKMMVETVGTFKISHFFQKGSSLVYFDLLGYVCEAVLHGSLVRD